MFKRQHSNSAWLLFFTLFCPMVLAQQEVRGRITSAQEAVKYLDLPSKGTWCIQLDQEGIDLSLEVTIGTSQRLLAVDSPQDEWGDERLALAVDKATRVTVTLKSVEKTGAEGSYRLAWFQLPEENHRDRLAIQAELAATRAGETYLESGPSNWRAAIEAHQNEALLRAQLSQDRLEARALYCLGVLHRLLEQHQQAKPFVQKALVLQKQLGNGMGQGFSTNELGLIELNAGNLEAASRWFQEAVKLRRQLRQPGLQAASQNNVCLTLLHQGRFEEAVPCLQEALAQSEQGRRASTQLAAHTNLGRLFDRLAQPTRAREHYNAALKLTQQRDPGWGSARLHNNLGAFYQRLGSVQDAYHHYYQALRLFRELGEKRWEARVLNNLANAYINLNQPERALPLLELALPLRREKGDKRGELATLINLGLACESSGRLALGLGHFATAGALAAEENRTLDLSRANMGTARIFLRQQQPDLALMRINQALADLNETNYPLEAAQAHLIKGHIQRVQDKTVNALEQFAIAEKLFRKQESGNGIIASLYQTARAHKDLNQVALAKTAAGLAINQIEALHSQIHLDQLRRSFFATHHQVYTLMVELEMATIAEGKPSPERAFIWSERSKAREYIQLQRQAEASTEATLPGIRDPFGSNLRMEIQAKAQRLQKFRNGGGSPEKIHRATLALEEALGNRDRHEAQRQRHRANQFPASGSGIPPSDIQKVLDPQTQMLVYCLSEEGSFVWRLSQSEIQAYELPLRKELAQLAEKAYWELARVSSRRPGNTNLNALANILLKPAEHLEDVEKLIVVPDGTLHIIPFGVLPTASRNHVGGLLQDYEITYLPSAGSLVGLQRRFEKKPQNSNRIAIYADPVFQATDPRIPKDKQGQRDILRSNANTVFSRLPATMNEAQSVRQLAKDPFEVTTFSGFEANLDQVISRDMTQFRYIHFATHTQIDTTYPELSALLLSQVDENGRPRPGHLRIHHLKQLPLDADLVVLSGCETAMGKMIRGEGLAGLARGFLDAQAGNVLASLWPVPDGATAEFMNRFYQALLSHKQPIAAALRHAQTSMKADVNWRHPFYWAGWVLIGTGR